MKLISSLTIGIVFGVPAFATNTDSLALKSKASLSILEREKVEIYSYDIIEFESDRIPVDENIFNYHVSSLEHIIPMEYNTYVKRQIDYFGINWQAKLKEVITRSQFYFPIYEKILDKNNMPLELKYLSVIESALNPYAVSRSGAVGPWQFMPATGRLFDLNINYIVDERRSLEKSTQAAAEYLQSMYERYGDWYLAIASYNCGPGNVNKAMRYSGKKDFWGIYAYLPRETQSYVPKFIAMAYMMNFYREYGITANPPEDIKSVYHPVYCGDNMAFSVIMDRIDISSEDLLAYNPELKQKVIPKLKNDNGYWLNLPLDKVELFYELENEIISLSEVDNLAQKEREAAEPKIIYHKVKRGECCTVIARRYGCTVSQLKKWNNLRGSVIHPNQRLKIYRS